jgi:site-specific recombinase XerD
VGIPSNQLSTSLIAQSHEQIDRGFILVFSEAINQFLSYLHTIDRSPQTLRGYRNHLFAFVRFMERQYNVAPYVEDITEEDLLTYMHFLKQDRKQKPSSRARAQNAFRSFYRYVVKQGWAPVDLSQALPPIRVHPQERVYLTEEEVMTLIEHLDTPLIQLVTFFLYRTGLRISECLALTLDTVDLTDGIVYVMEGKGNKDRVVPLAPDLWEQLNHYVLSWRPAVTSKQFFVTSRTGGLSVSRVNQALGNTARSLNWKKNVSSHILRHSFASRLLQQGASLVAVQKLLGHSSLDVTGIYTHVARDDLVRAVGTLVMDTLTKETATHG